MIQGSEEWFAARLGKVTASRVIDIMPGKRGYGASRKNYMAELVCERLSGQRQESYTNAAMQWGTDTEPLARSAYEAITGEMVTEVGFIDHPIIPMFGASPDGLVGAAGGTEFKCPNTATHIDTFINDTIKYAYIIQMHVCMMCTERIWWDFVSYDPRLPDRTAYYSKRIEMDPDLLGKIFVEVKAFGQELDDMMEALA